MIEKRDNTSSSNHTYTNSIVHYLMSRLLIYTYNISSIVNTRLVSNTNFQSFCSQRLGWFQYTVQCILQFPAMINVQETPTQHMQRNAVRWGCRIVRRSVRAKMTNQNAPILFLPSESSTKYHLLQLYLFIMIWTYSETKLEPNDRRRKIMDCHYIPILSDMDLTPESLIRINQCNCKAGCTTKYGLPCTEACGLCQRE